MELELTLIKYEADKNIERRLTQTNMPEVGGIKENMGPCMSSFSLLIDARYTSKSLNPTSLVRDGSSLQGSQGRSCASVYTQHPDLKARNEIDGSNF